MCWLGSRRGNYAIKETISCPKCGCFVRKDAIYQHQETDKCKRLSGERGKSAHDKWKSHITELQRLLAREQQSVPG